MVSHAAIIPPFLLFSGFGVERREQSGLALLVVGVRAGDGGGSRSARIVTEAPTAPEVGDRLLMLGAGTTVKLTPAAGRGGPLLHLQCNAKDRKMRWKGAAPPW
jgi:hypothetical protein